MRVDEELFRQVRDLEGSLDERLRELAKPLLSEREQLLATHDELQQALKYVRQGLDRLNRLLKAAGLVEQQPRKPKRPSKASADAVERIVRWLAEQAEPRSNKEISAGVGLHPTTVAKALTRARADDLIRFTGKRKTAHHSPPEHLYAAFPNGDRP